MVVVEIGRSGRHGRREVEMVLGESWISSRLMELRERANRPPSNPYSDFGGAFSSRFQYVLAMDRLIDQRNGSEGL